MSTPAEIGLSRWHEVVETRDPEALAEMVADNATFHSPAVFKAQEGKPLVVAYLTAALKVLAEDFSYGEQWVHEREVILEFSSRLDNLDIFGIDRITFDDEGAITDFTVMARPLKALNLLVEKMGTELSALAEAARGS